MKKILITMFLLSLFATVSCDGGGKDDVGNTGNDLSGTWEGNVQVEGTKYLKNGTFPAKFFLAQSGQKVRGILDINQDAAFMSEWFGHYFEGTVSGNVLEIELSDRNCAGVDPDQAICMPRWEDHWGEGKTKVFNASLTLDGKGLSGEAPTVLSGIDYPEDVPIELPFVHLDLELKTVPADEPDDSSLAGTWKGPFNPPYSIAFAGIRMFGVNTVEFEIINEDMTLARFDNNDTNIYPTHEDIILVDTFKYDDTTKRFWFREAGTVYGWWLWIGELRGDAIVGHFVSEPIDSPIWQEDAAPVDPFSLPFINFEATFQFNRQ